MRGFEIVRLDGDVSNPRVSGVVRRLVVVNDVVGILKVVLVKGSGGETRPRFVHDCGSRS